VPQERNKNSKDTSWHEVASWYDAILQDDDSYQNKVILPNVLRLLDIKKEDKVLDLACGQGYFSNILYKTGAEIVGVDLGEDLIKIAKEKNKDIKYFVSPSHDLNMLYNNYFDKVIIILALQNIKKVRETFKEIKRVLKKDGQLFIVLNHPAFRIPQKSNWVIKEDKHSREIESYMSEFEIKIDMHPGQKDKIFTRSFHRPIQWYVKHAIKEGFVLSGLEEWISHKESQKGPHKEEEDRIRKEIPMFMCMVYKSI
jgi:ubiquinone/menaquinone biosynthesis C-methylase UbiE